MIDFYFADSSDERVIAYLEQRGEKVVTAVAGEMTRVLVEVRSTVMANLSGGVLEQRSGNLARSVSAPNVTTSTGDITGLITQGKEAPYGVVHEYGGTFTVREHLRRTKKGMATVRSHSATYPERSFMRSALEAHKAEIIERLTEVAQEAAATE